MRRLTSLTLLLSLATFARAMEIPAAWTRPVEPVRIVGNIYYVGTEDLGSYLIAGDEGAILLDAPMEENVPLILRNIEKLGFSRSRIRILLNSHAHLDHAGGLAKMKDATGAKLHLSAADAELAARGGRNDFAFGDTLTFTPVTADATVHDGQVVRLGDVSMTAMITPGHTRGCTTWRTTVEEKGKTLDVVFLCSVTAPGYTLVKNEKYPGILDDYRQTFERLRALDPDVFLANHGSFFKLPAKLAKKAEGGANPFIERGAMRAHLDAAWKAIEEAVAKQSAPPPARHAH